MDKYIEKVDTTKFLGMEIDSNMTWDTYSLDICNRLYRFSYALYKLTKTVDQTTALMAYHAFVGSALRYGIIFYGNSSYRDQILIAQKRCIRAICGLRYRDSCKPYFNSLHLLTFPCLYILECSLFVKTNPHLFIERKTATSHTFRPREITVHLNYCKTALMKKSILQMGPRIFNKLPQEMKCLDTTKLKNRLKDLLIKKCFYSLEEYFNDNLV